MIGVADPLLLALVSAVGVEVYDGDGALVRAGAGVRGPAPPAKLGDASEGMFGVCTSNAAGASQLDSRVRTL